MRVSALVLLAAVGCAHAPKPTAPHAADPTPTLRAWAEAIARNDAHAAYGLLSSSLRARTTESDFALQWRAAQADLSAQEEALRAPATVRRAVAATPDGRAWPLARDDGGWRVAAARPAEAAAATPEEALRRLVAAVEARDVDAVLALFAEPLRSSIEQALADRVGRLKAALRKGPIETSGNTARVRYDSRYHLDLVRENGSWRIADFN